MAPFDIEITLATGEVKLSVMPYEYPANSRNTAFEIIRNKVWVGSILINADYHWEGFAGLPWENADMLKIGYEITNHYL
jgi:hypothetical protein